MTKTTNTTSEGQRSGEDRWADRNDHVVMVRRVSWEMAMEYVRVRDDRIRAEARAEWEEERAAIHVSYARRIDRARAEGREEITKHLYAEFSTLAGDMVTDTGEAEPVDSFTRERALDIIFRAGRPTTEGGSDR